jgi:asparagine synthase (glutamine-hydrolysing)
MDLVLAKGGVEPHHIHADRLDPLDPLLFNADEPRVVPNMYLDWSGFKEAHRHGVRSVLSGVDGDSTISYGHGYFADLARGFKWMTLYREATAFSQRMGWTLRFTLWHFGIRNLVPPTARRSWRRIRGKRPSLLPFEVPINPDFAERTGLFERVRMLDGDDAVLPETGRESHILALMNGLNLYAPEILDKVGAGFSLEPRLPFFDRRMVEFCVSLPTHLKLKRGWSRYIMRQAMAGVLPSEVQWRVGKGNLSPNIRQGLWNHSRPALEQVLIHQPGPLGPYLDIGGVQDAYRRFEQAPMQTTDGDLYIILLAFTLGHWLDKTGLN